MNTSEYSHICSLNQPLSHFKNDSWIPLAEAAIGSPYGADYLRLLARQEKILSKKVDDVWYTTRASIRDYAGRQKALKSGSLLSEKSRVREIRNYGEFFSDLFDVEEMQSEVRRPKTRLSGITFVSFVLSLFVMISMGLINQAMIPNSASVLSSLSGIFDTFASKQFAQTSGATSTTTSAITQSSVELDLGSYKSELKTSIVSELESYIQKELEKVAKLRVVSNPIINTTVLREDILLADTRPTVTRQSDADAGRRGALITNVTTDGVFTTPTINGGTINNTSATLSTLTVSGNTTLNGLVLANDVFTSTAQSTFTKVPTLAHVFSPWPSGTSNGDDGTIYINPSSSIADGNLISAAVGGNIKFLVDAEGDIYGGNLILSGSTSQGETTIAGNLTVQDNTVFGDASSDTVTFTAGATFTGSTTLQSFTATNSTTTNATTTNLFATTGNFTNLYGNTANLTEAGSNLFYTDTRVNSYIHASTTIPKTYTDNTFTGTNTFGNLTVSNILATASSTFQTLTFTNATGTSATTTSFFSTTASSTSLFSSTASFGAASIAGALTLRGVTYTLPSADGSSGQVLTTNGSGVLSWSTKTEGISQDFKGLSLRTSPNADIATTTVVLDHADEIVMDTGNRVTDWNDLSANIASSGAGGLDAGAEAASTWYEIYAIRKSSDGTKNLLLHRAKDYFLDESDTGTANAVPLRDASTKEKLAQTFDTDVTGSLEFVDIPLTKVSSPTGRIWVSIYATSGGAPTGAALKTSDKADVANITTGHWIRFMFRDPLSVTAGVTYAIVLEGDFTISGVNHVYWLGNVGNTYAAGSQFSYNGTTWTDQSRDQGFKAYVTRYYNGATASATTHSVTMPTGYDQKAHVGYVYNNSSSNFKPFIALDRNVKYESHTGNIAVNAGTSVTPVLTDISSILPPTPVFIGQTRTFVGGAAGRVYIASDQGLSDSSWRSFGTVASMDGTGDVYDFTTDTYSQTQAFYYAIESSTSGTIAFLGYTWGSSGGADVAEEYLVEDESIAPGDVVSISETGSLYIERSEASSTQPVFGIVSTKPGVRLTDLPKYTTNNRPVALTGRIPVKISEENGAIKSGDRLTLSKTIPGTAMKQIEPGQSIGMALEASAGKDKVMTFLNLSYWVPAINLTISNSTTTASTTASTTDQTFSSTVLDSLMSYVIKVFRDVFQIVFEEGLVRVASVIADKLTTKELCLEDVCVNKTQLQALLANTGTSASSTSEQAPSDNDNQSVSNEDTTGETTFTEIEIEEETATTTPDTAEEVVSEEETATSTEEVVTEEVAPEPAETPGEVDSGDSTSTEETTT
jgi:hypothetical protein